MGILAGKNERGCMEMESDSLYQLEKEITVRIIQEDMESIYSLMCTEKDPIFSMAILPYYALFVQACQEYMGEEYLPNVEAKRVKDIRNYIKSYGEQFGKTKRKIQDIAKIQDRQFRDILNLDIMKQMNNYVNIGTYWLEDKIIVGSTQMYADFLEIENVFDPQCAKLQLELGYQLGRFVAGVKKGFENCIYQPVVKRREESIKIGYYADLNINIENHFFAENSIKEVNLFFLHLLCNMNFVKHILRKLFGDGNKWVFRVEYIVVYYTYRALRRLKNYCENNDDIKLNLEMLNEIFDKGDVIFQSNFRNCMMHYGLENRNVLSYEYIEKEFFGIVETCFEGQDYQTYIISLRELSDMIIVFLENRFDITKIEIRPL